MQGGGGVNDIAESVSSEPTGTSKKERFVHIIRVLVSILWAATASVGCYAFYLGFDTKVEEVRGDSLCIKHTSTNDTSCSITTNNRKLWD